MKKSVLILLALFALIAASCNSEATVDQATTASGAVQDAAVESADSNAEDPAGLSDGPDDAEEPAAPAPTEVPAASAAPAPAPTVDTSSATAQLGSDDWCTAARQIEETVLGGDDFDAVADPVSLEESYTAAAALINEAVRIAPPAIAPDVAASAAAFAELNVLLADADWDFLAVDLAAMQAAAEGMAIPGYNIEKYNYDVCGIGEDPGDAPVFTEDEFDEPLPSGSARDLMVESFMSGGFTEAESLCIVDQIDITNPEALGDPQAILSAFNECGISLDRLSDLGG